MGNCNESRSRMACNHAKHYKCTILSRYLVVWLLSSATTTLSSGIISASSNPSSSRFLTHYERQNSKDHDNWWRIQFKRKRDTMISSFRIPLFCLQSRFRKATPSYHWISNISGGAKDQIEYDEDEYDDEDEDDDDSDLDDKEDSDEIISIDESTANTSSDNTDDGIVVTFDEPLMPSPYVNMFASIFVMLLGRKYDLLQPTLVKIARFCFISYLIILQLFLIYIRIQAKLLNNRTPIEVSNPLTSLIQSQLLGGNASNENNGTNNIIKSLASSFLSTKLTIGEYDMKQARSMQSGLIFNMLFMWFLHFKMNQVQPLLIQSLTGYISLIYHPLFQVYILNRNLERPFKSANLPPGSTAAEMENQEKENEGERTEEEKNELLIEEAEDDDNDADEESMEEEVDED